MKNVLVVVDMQNDFVTGSVGSKEAQAILPYAIRKVEAARAAGTDIVFTLDTHSEDYLQTCEGQTLPIEHCIKGTDGWAFCSEIEDAVEGLDIPRFEKGAFGSPELAVYLRDQGYTDIEFIGICTDICVISNAIMVRSMLPEAKVSVDAKACAGITPEGHETALEAMRICHINIH